MSFPQKQFEHNSEGRIVFGVGRFSAFTIQDA